MRAFFAEENRHKQDEIALRQLHALKEYHARSIPRLSAARMSGAVNWSAQMTAEHPRDDPNPKRSSAPNQCRLDPPFEFIPKRMHARVR